MIQYHYAQEARDGLAQALRQIMVKRNHSVIVGMIGFFAGGLTASISTLPTLPKSLLVAAVAASVTAAGFVVAKIR